MIKNDFDFYNAESKTNPPFPPFPSLPPFPL